MSGDQLLDGQIDILVEDGLIVGMGAGLPSDGDAEAIDATGSVVMPGLIDTHRHLWYTPIRASAMDHGFGDLIQSLWPTVESNLTADNLYAATRAGIVDALDRGITTVLDYCHAINTPGHAERAIEAHLGLPGRALFGYGPTLKVKSDIAAASTGNWTHAEAMNDALTTIERSRTTMALAIQNPSASTSGRFHGDVEAARGMGVPITAHIAPRAGGPLEFEVARMQEWGLLGPDMHLSHCCGTTFDEFQMIRDAGATVTVSPMAEWWLGFGVPLMHMMHRAGLMPAVGADAVCSSSGDLFEEARAGLLAARAAATAELAAQGRALEFGSELGMTTYDALATITVRAAAACSMSTQIGTLEVGKLADIIVIRGRQPVPEPDDVVPWVISTVHGSDVHTVIVDGVVVKRNGALVGIDVDEIAADTVAARRSMLGRN
jgi:5-methylthioadenosine/S-adenosylhomocysteine deaminase